MKEYLVKKRKGDINIKCGEKAIQGVSPVEIYCQQGNIFSFFSCVILSLLVSIWE